MDIGLFDNFEDDGQLSLFGMGEGVEDLRETDPAEVREANPAEAGERLPSSGSAGIRIRQCSCCGKLLFVKEEGDCYLAACNACGVSYVQKK